MTATPEDEKVVRIHADRKIPEPPPRQAPKPLWGVDAKIVFEDEAVMLIRNVIWALGIEKVQYQLVPLTENVPTAAA